MRRLRALLLALLRAARCSAQAEPRLVPDVSQRRDRDPLQLHRRRAAAVRRDPLSGRPDARAERADIAVVLKGPLERIVLREKQKVAGIWMNVERRPLPLGARLLRGRLVAAAVAAGRRAHRGDLRARPRQSPALARRRRLARGAAPLRGGPDRPAGGATSSMPNIRAASRSAKACSTAPASRSRRGCRSAPIPPRPS